MPERVSTEVDASLNPTSSRDDPLKSRRGGISSECTVTTAALWVERQITWFWTGDGPFDALLTIPESICSYTRPAKRRKVHSV